MPIFDPTDVDEPENLALLPDGIYPAEIVEASAAVSKNDNDMIDMKFKVIDHEFAGQIFYDRIIFTEKLKPRIKLITKRLGFDVDNGPFDIQPEMLIGRKCQCDIFTETYTNNDGDEKQKNAVQFGGYFDFGDGTNNTPREDGSFPDDPF